MGGPFFLARPEGPLGEHTPQCHHDVVVGVPVRVHSWKGDDLGVAHIPPPVRVGDVLELGHGPMLPQRVVELVETGPHSPLAALVKVAPARAVVR
jgi:hypothetical protein